MTVEVDIIEGIREYIYETREHKVKCVECKREYKRRKRCLKCGSKTEPIVKIHTGHVKRDLTAYACDCVFGSWWRFGKHWKDNHPKSRCKHMQWAIKKINKRREENETN